MDRNFVLEFVRATEAAAIAAAGAIETHSLAARSKSGTVRFIETSYHLEER